MNSVTFAKAMADETRQQIMRLLCCQWLCVNDVVEQSGVTQPTVSHHLSILREAGLVNTRREGKQVFYTLDQDAMAVCCGVLLQKFAPERVDLVQPDEISVHTP
ncbi:MAG: metalloregulator ArsR/SmtB family transcription factor [Chloroflexi bacterium]|nr:metalloregulator ArsR/SmtB family transcription factor [Chloroflexota bacterium]MCI0575557.1 metalloregulator ArsR/SmtB family transcription factor [Chloroflexota bacterium]MCI0649963.1 metalloregulator ArsR/SmtB family transcription factor [Chloroflexota bacterium]MCI0729293.1 metalloregulator ArsR/SmtB family transcription factor [Chloroflexota bacterium]